MHTCGRWIDEAGKAELEDEISLEHSRCRAHEHVTEGWMRQSEDRDGTADTILSLSLASNRWGNRRSRLARCDPVHCLSIVGCHVELDSAEWDFHSSVQ